MAHKTRQFEDWLSDALENFRRHQEGLILRIPRIVRNVTLRDFAKYNGDIQECVKGLKRDMLGVEDNTIDAGTRKRKWIESQETEDKLDGKLGHTESSRAIKTGMMLALRGDGIAEGYCSSYCGCYTKEETFVVCCAYHCIEDAPTGHQDPSEGMHVNISS